MRDLTFCCCPGSSVFIFQEEVVCLRSVVGLDFVEQCSVIAVRKTPDLASPVPSRLADRLGLPPEGQIVVNLPHRASWSLYKIERSGTRKFAMSEIWWNFRKKTEEWSKEEERTQKGQRASESTFCLSVGVPPLVLFLGPPVCFPVVWVSNWLPATVLLIVGLAKIPDPPAVLYVLLWGLLWWK